MNWAINYSDLTIDLGTAEHLRFPINNECKVSHEIIK